MVSLVKLSSSNLDEFKKLYEKNFERATYDKDFFEYYTNQSFIPKILLKRFVKLFMFNGEYIGYIWYEVPINIQIKILSLYIDKQYVDIIDNSILKKFNDKYLIYESIESNINNTLLSNLGFKKVKLSKIMNLKLTDYNKKDEIKKIRYNLYNDINITFEKVDIKNDALLRCDVQNSIFKDIDRVPIDVEDIENDFKQDYYIEDLAIFMKINNNVVAYGQIIYTRKMFTVVNFGVIDAYRGKSLGKILLDYLINKAKDKNISELALGVAENNFNAISLYNWIGFSEEYNVSRWIRE